MKSVVYTVGECTLYGGIYSRRRKKSLVSDIGAFVAVASSRRVYSTDSMPNVFVTGRIKTVPFHQIVIIAI